MPLRRPWVDVVFESYESTIRLTRGVLIISRPISLSLPLMQIEGIILYRDHRIGFILSNDEVVDVPAPEADKLRIAEAISKAAGIASAATI